MSERDQRLDAAYREAATDEPRPETDERIRAAARRAVAAGPQSLEARARADAQRSWTARWRVPASIAATVVIAVTLSYMVQDEEVRKARIDGVPATPAPVRESAAPPAAATAKVQEAPAPAAPPAQAPAAVAAKRAAPAADAANAASRPEPVPFPAPAASERRSADEARAPAPVGAPPATSRADEAPGAGALSKEVERAERQTAAPAAAQPAEAARMQAEPASPALRVAPSAVPPAAPAPMAKPAPPTRERTLADRPAGRLEREAASGLAEQKVRTPEEWLEDIRRLKTQGRTEDVAKELAEFRKRYPDYKLPADMLQ
jgi:Meckel syndrome type 1 protein